MKVHVCRESDFIWKHGGTRPVALKYIGNYPDIVINHSLVVWGPGGCFATDCFTANPFLVSISFAKDVVYKVCFTEKNASAGFAFCKSLKSIENLPPSKYTYAFMDCKNLEYVSFIHLPCPDVSYAFYGCKSLKYVVDLDRRSQGYASAFASLSQKVDTILSADFD